MNLEFYKINFEEKENDQRNISVGIVRMFPGRIHLVWPSHTVWVISKGTIRGRDQGTGPNRSEIFKMLLVLVRSEIRQFFSVLVRAGPGFKFFLFWSGPRFLNFAGHGPGQTGFGPWIPDQRLSSVPDCDCNCMKSDDPNRRFFNFADALINFKTPAYLVDFPQPCV